MITHTTTQSKHKQNEQHGQDRLFFPVLIISWLINFSMYLVSYLSVTVMALYAIQRFSASGAAGGFVASSFVVGTTIARLFSSYLVDTFGGRRITLSSLAVIITVCTAHMWTVSLSTLTAIHIIHDLTHTLASITVMAAVQTAIPASCRAEGTGYISLGTTLATAIGSAFGLTPIGLVGYSVFFATALGLSIARLVLMLFLSQYSDPTTVATEDEAIEDSSANETKRALSFDDIMMPRAIPTGLFTLPIGLACVGVVTFLNRYLQLDGPTKGASFFLVVYAVAMVATCFLLGRLQDRYGDNPVIAVGLVYFTISLLALVFATADWHTIAADVFCGLGYSTLISTCQTIFVHLASAHKLGTGISTLLLLVGVGIDPGPTVLGSIAATMGFNKMYVDLAVVVILAAAFYWFVHNHKPVVRHHRVDLQN